ncbi:hypothetical protein CMsap09_16125 [Clavibacter michiganensis]|uniref:Uncharacterized protein n=1 Tax=Clavibacter michiganensis TaxID=28447 RepID=A0A251XY46_9MICO|nr:hypothetical protein CMsap09_16125 [Clavibacter michiganensis]
MSAPAPVGRRPAGGTAAGRTPAPRSRAGRRPAARIPGTFRLPVVGTRLRRREALVGAALAVAILAVALVALGTGDFP